MIRPEVGKRYLVTRPGISFRATVKAIGATDGVDDGVSEFVSLRDVREHPDLVGPGVVLTCRIREWEWEEIQQ